MTAVADASAPASTPPLSLLAYLDFLPRAFLLHGLPLSLCVDCHSFFLSSLPDALTQLGATLHFYGVTFRYASSPQAKGRGGGGE